MQNSPSRGAAVIPLPSANARKPGAKPPLQPHQERVVEEQAELAVRIERLTAFLAGTVFSTLPAAEQDCMRRQLVAMESYDAALLERIEAFGSAA